MMCSIQCLSILMTDIGGNVASYEAIGSGQFSEFDPFFQMIRFVRNCAELIVKQMKDVKRTTITST